ncbi:hypothetical protein MRX96_035480 [Rhipicephalus microplus]
MPSLTLHPSSAVVPRSYRFAVKVPLVVWNTLMATARMGFLGGSVSGALWPARASLPNPTSPFFVVFSSPCAVAAVSRRPLTAPAVTDGRVGSDVSPCSCWLRACWPCDRRRASRRAPWDPKLVDLSYVFDKNTVYPSPSANFSMDVHYRKTKHGVRYQEENICSSTQGGTHVIVPRHLLKGRWSVTDLPLNQAGGARRGHRRQHPGSA